MRRAGIFWWRDEAAADTRREWKDRSRASGGDDRAPAGIARAKAAHTQHHASDGAGDIVSARRDRPDRGVARRRSLLLHMDGARFANAVAALECAPKAITWEAGVDALCFGGTKN